MLLIASVREEDPMRILSGQVRRSEPAGGHMISKRSPPDRGDKRV